MAGPSTPLRVTRYIYLGLINLFLVGILAQAYFIGRFLFGVDTESTLHVDLGWLLAHMFAALVLLVSFFTRGGRNMIIASIVWGITAFLLPVLAGIGLEGNSTVGSLHPPVALLLFALTFWLVYRAWNLAMVTPPGPTPQTRPTPTNPGTVNRPRA